MATKQGYVRGQGRFAKDVKISEGNGDPGNSSGKTRELDWRKIEQPRPTGPLPKHAFKGRD
jgi:hypothetical protein